MDDIDAKYLFNFSLEEKLKFDEQKKREQAMLEKFEDFLRQRIRSHSSQIFTQSSTAFSVLDVKYHINRLMLNDPTLTHLWFGDKDPVKKAIKISELLKAIKQNIYCVSYRFGGFSDAEVNAILNALYGKKVHITLYGDLLTDKTYSHAAYLLSKPANRWKSVSFGTISPSAKVKQLLDVDKRIIYSTPPAPRYMQITNKPSLIKK